MKLIDPPAIKAIIASAILGVIQYGHAFSVVYRCRALAVLICALVAVACSGEGSHPAAVDREGDMSERELIVLAAPKAGDAYYAEVADTIRDFHANYAKSILDYGDDVLIFVDNATYTRYAEIVPEDHLVIAPMDDIWMRDFSPSHTSRPVMFRYSAAGQGGGRRGQSDADVVQENLAAILEAADLDFSESDLLNDGGNFVDDYADRAVVSRKFLRDNNLSDKIGRDLLKAVAGLSQVAFIEADEQGGVEHSDGVVAFIQPNVLVINAYPDDPEYAQALKSDLHAGLPGVRIHEIVSPYDASKVYDERFGSACRLYTNMLVTPKRIYLPQFGIPEDAEALADMRRWSDKEVVPVRSAAVCAMGGGVRCMSWQLRGKNVEKLLDWAARRRQEKAGE